MIIDTILDRKDGHGYKPEDLTRYDKQLNTGDNKQMQTELCRYIIRNNYPTDLCSFILSKDWTQPEDESPFQKWFGLRKALELRDMSILCLCGLEDTTTNGLIFDMACNQWHHDDDTDRRAKLLNDYAAVLQSID